MRQRKFGILSLDISAVSTGWTFCVKDHLRAYGIIRTEAKFSTPQRLLKFREELSKVIRKYHPSFIVVENNFAGGNIKTLKVLSEFAGVAKELSVSDGRVDPFVLNNKIVKAHFGLKKKEEVFKYIMENYLLEKDFNYKEHNDIVDAYAQSVCFYESVILKK
jgi:Holliday junction resolvasome RuvABC endonuclease subunit